MLPVALYVTHVPFVKTHVGILIVLSLFVLGGEFWDKIRSLFIHDAKASFFL